MVQSRYLTDPIDWADRIRTMREDLMNEDYDYLFFKISLNLIDAVDNADYDRETILRKMLDAYKKMKDSVMYKCLERLEAIK